MFGEGVEVRGSKSRNSGGGVVVFFIVGWFRLGVFIFIRLVRIELRCFEKVKENAVGKSGFGFRILFIVS